jgi:XTP/dITP diphosphohydrolase
VKIVLATKNAGKLKELQKLAGEQCQFDFILAPDDFDAIEDGDTFEANALIKASKAAMMTGLYAIADDSGIAVDFLDGAPGIYSARYCAGDDRDRRLKLLEVMKAVPEEKRGGAFVCAMALCAPDGSTMHTNLKHWRGKITHSEQGEHGFGYDPIFFLEEQGKTSAEITAEEKNLISHRGQAFREMLTFMLQNLREI